MRLEWIKRGVRGPERTEETSVTPQNIAEVLTQCGIQFRIDATHRKLRWILFQDKAGVLITESARVIIAYGSASHFSACVVQLAEAAASAELEPLFNAFWDAIPNRAKREWKS